MSCYGKNRECLARAAVRMKPHKAPLVRDVPWDSVEYYGILNLQKRRCPDPHCCSDDHYYIVQPTETKDAKPWMAFTHNNSFGDRMMFLYDNKIAYPHHILRELTGSFMMLSDTPIDSMFMAHNTTEELQKELDRIMPIFVGDDCVSELAREMSEMRHEGRGKESICEKFKKEDADLVGAALALAFGDENG